MQVYIDNTILKFENDPQNTEQIFNTIQDHIDQKERHLKHLIIDEVPIYHDFQKCIEENATTIQKIEIVTQTLNEYITEIFISTNDYINKSIPLINNLARVFSKKPSAKAWSELIDLLEGIVWIIQTVEKINSLLTIEHTLSNYGTWRIYVENIADLEDMFSKFEKGITGKENKIIENILLNEIIPLFEQIKVQTKYLKNYMMICI